MKKFDPYKNIYCKNGKFYRRLKRNEVIKEGAMQSFGPFELQPVADSNDEIVGRTPSSFSDIDENERRFYNLI